MCCLIYIHKFTTCWFIETNGNEPQIIVQNQSRIQSKNYSMRSIESATKEFIKENWIWRKKIFLFLYFLEFYPSNIYIAMHFVVAHWDADGKQIDPLWFYGERRRTRISFSSRFFFSFFTPWIILIHISRSNILIESISV